MYLMFAKTRVLCPSLPNDKIVDWSKFKEFTDDNMNVVKMTISGKMLLSVHN